MRLELQSYGPACHLCGLCVKCCWGYVQPLASCLRPKRGMAVPDTLLRLQVHRSSEERSTSIRRRYLARRATGGS